MSYLFTILNLFTTLNLLTVLNLFTIPKQIFLLFFFCFLILTLFLESYFFPLFVDETSPNSDARLRFWVLLTTRVSVFIGPWRLFGAGGGDPHALCLSHASARSLHCCSEKTTPRLRASALGTTVCMICMYVCMYVCV